MCIYMLPIIYCPRPTLAIYSGGGCPNRTGPSSPSPGLGVLGPPELQWATAADVGHGAVRRKSQSNNDFFKKHFN